MRAKLALAAIAVTILSFQASEAQTPAAASKAAPASEANQALVQKYCATCHSDRVKTAGLTLQSLNVANPSDHADVWERAIRKVRVGAMPPQGMPRPSKIELDGLVSRKFRSIFHRRPRVDDQMAAVAPRHVRMLGSSHFKIFRFEDEHRVLSGCLIVPDACPPPWNPRAP